MLYLLEQVERSLLFFLTFIRLGRHSFKGVYHNIGAGVLTKLASTCSGEISCPPSLQGNLTIREILPLNLLFLKIKVGYCSMFPKRHCIALYNKRYYLQNVKLHASRAHHFKM